MSHFGKDLKFAWRVFRKSPGFTVIAVLTLAFGIGANTAVFSVVDSVLLRPLPFPEPEELVQVWSQFPTMEFFEFWLSQPEYETLKEEIDSFEILGAYSFGGRNLSRDGISPVRITVSFADQDFFETLGLTSRVGRTFSAEEDSPGGNPAAILSYPLWRDSFGEDSGVVGQSIFLDGVKTDVIGVMPPGITVVSGSNVDAWLPMQLNHANPRPRGNHFIRVLGRLKEGRSFEQAQAEMETWLAAADQTQHVLNAQSHPVLMVPLHEQITGDVRTALVLLLGAVTFVLLICCVNVANFFLARAGGRRREIAVRSALGAGRKRLVSQLLSESVLIALTGGVLGYALARLGVGLLLALNPASLPRDVPTQPGPTDPHVYPRSVHADRVGLFGFAAAVAGGWVTCRIGNHPTNLPVKLLAGFVFLLGLVLAVLQLGQTPPQLPEGMTVSELVFTEAGQYAVSPTWVTCLLPALGAVGALLGGSLGRKK